MEEIEQIDERVIEYIHKAFELWLQCPILGYGQFDDSESITSQMDEFCFFARNTLTLTESPKKQTTKLEAITVEKCPRRIP
jgi:hypothetical protein